MNEMPKPLQVYIVEDSPIAERLLTSAIAAAGAEDAATPHGTQKPVEAMRRPIVNNSARTDLIYEPFCGSGTTLIAAETLGVAAGAEHVATARTAARRENPAG